MTKFHKNVRLPTYDYSTPGYYFVTIVVAHRRACLGNIDGETMILSPMGEIVKQGWLWLAKQYPFVRLDEYVIMPNHLHGILQIVECGSGCGGVNESAARLSMGRLVAAFKTVTTREINRFESASGRKFWQDDFYEHVVRNDHDLRAIQEYVRNNPLQWMLDQENPDRID
ncbi:MAG: transposase [Calditrichota bacterium]